MNAAQNLNTNYLYLIVLDGGWSNWSEYGPCRCETNTQTRNRECNSPIASRGGLNCTGYASEAVDCTPGSCPGMYCVNSLYVAQ